LSSTLDRSSRRSPDRKVYHTPFGVSDGHSMCGIDGGEFGSACVRLDARPANSRRVRAWRARRVAKRTYVQGSAGCRTGSHFTPQTELGADVNGALAHTGQPPVSRASAAQVLRLDALAVVPDAQAKLACTICDLRLDATGRADDIPCQVISSFGRPHLAESKRRVLVDEDLNTDWWPYIRTRAGGRYLTCPEPRSLLSTRAVGSREPPFDLNASSRPS
jgi:hypothetical protein